MLAGGGGDTGEFGGPFDEEAVRLQVEERQAELRRVPGQEPQMVPVYTEASTPTDAAQLPRGEQSRQIAAKGVRMYAVILVDGKIVGTSGVTNLHPHDFCAPFDSAVQLQLLHAPTTMSVQLWERRLGGLADSMVSESFLAVPDVASPPMPDWQMYSFSAERTFTPRAAYQLGAKEDAAADSDLDADVRRLPRRCVSGQLAVSIAWSAQPATHERAARAAEASVAGASSFITAHARGKPLEGAHAAMPGALDPLRVGEHVRADELDPNAPQDAPLLSLLARADRAGAKGAFRAHRLANQLQWVRGGAAALSDRTRLLDFRRTRPLEWSRLPADERIVPPTDALIPRRMRELLKPEAQRRGGDDDDDDDADERGAKQKGRLRAWVATVLARQEVAKATRSYVTQTGDFVREPIADSEPPHRAHRTARPLRSPCPLPLSHYSRRCTRRATRRPRPPALPPPPVLTFPRARPRRRGRRPPRSSASSTSSASSS